MASRQHGRRQPGYTTARGYGQSHQQRRTAALAALRDGDPCARCGGPMYRTQELHLDHSDDRGSYLGLAHKRCNLRAAARKTNATRRVKAGLGAEPTPHNPSRRW